jgi:phosphoadenosine phosphosulfate reductase
MTNKIEQAIAILQRARALAPAVFSTSLGLEDMVVTDLIVKHAPAIGLFTLDTGRLPPETLNLLAATEAHYKKRITVFYPQTQAVEHYVRLNGINGFFDSVSQRQDCCAVRKVEPLQRALAGSNAWVTGLRREQAASRAQLSESAFDSHYGLTKFNPLLDWTLTDVQTYIKDHDVPYNVLHDRGFPSIGCAPCTRAIAPGEDVRAGRWWWESADKKECGLHVAAAHNNQPQEASLV